MGKFKTGILTLLLGLFATAAFAQITPQAHRDNDGERYWTGDRKGKVPTANSGADSYARAAYPDGTKSQITDGTTTWSYDQLQIIDRNYMGTSPAVPYGPDFISYQMIGTKLPYFVSPSLINYPDLNLDPQNGGGIYPPKNTAGGNLTITSTWEWSVLGFFPFDAAATTSVTATGVGVMELRATADKANLTTGSPARNTQNYIEIDLAQKDKFEPGQTYQISVEEKGSCDATAASAAGWASYNTQFGITVTAPPAVGFNATGDASTDSPFKKLKDALATINTELGNALHLQPYEVDVPLTSMNRPAPADPDYSNSPLKGKNVFVVATCDENIIQSLAGQSLPLSMLSAENGLGGPQSQALKRYSFRLASMNYQVNTDLTCGDIADFTYVDLFGVNATTSVDQKVEFKEATTTNANPGYGTLDEANYTVPANLKLISGASGDVLYVDNIFMVMSPVGILNDAKTVNGVVSAISQRCDMPATSINPTPSPAKLPKAYCGDEIENGELKMAYALVIRSITPPRTGPIYYVPNSLYAQ